MGDDLLDTGAPAAVAEKPKRTRNKKPAGPSETKPAGPSETTAEAKAKPKAKKAASKKAKPKAKSTWSRAENFDEIKKQVKSKIGRLKQPIAVAELAEALGYDTNNVRWAARELEREKIAKVKLNSQNRLTVIGA